MDTGFNDHKYSVNEINGKQRKSYGAWKNMIRRCFDSKLQEEYPTYKGCTISDSFLNFSYFHEWCEDQIGYKEKGFHLDKDILVQGNKIYGKDTCAFIPNGLNQFLVNRINFRGGNPVGVSFNKRNGLFRSRVNNGFGKLLHVGYFENKEDAFNAYKEKKMAIALELISHYEGSVDERVLVSLSNLSFSIED